MRNRIIALLLACVMTVSLLPVSALAVEPSDTAAAQEATVITTAEEFAAMKPDGTYRLGADIAVDVPYSGGGRRYYLCDPLVYRHAACQTEERNVIPARRGR